MMHKKKKTSWVKFLLLNTGIYFLLICFLFFMFGYIMFGYFEGISTVLLIFIISITAKNALSYKTLYSARVIKKFEQKKILILPIFIIDLIISFLVISVIKQIDELDFLFYFSLCLYLILISMTFSIFSLSFFRKIKYYINTNKQKKYFSYILKTFCLLGIIFVLPFLYVNIIIPSAKLFSNSFINLIAIILCSSIIVFVENIIFLNLSVYFNLLNGLKEDIKGNLLAGFIIEDIILIFIGLIIVANFI